MKVTDISGCSDTYHCRKSASRYIQARFGARCAPQTLAKYASEGGGPRFQKFNRCPIYSEADLDIWVLSKLDEPTSAYNAPQAVTPEFILAMGGDPFAQLWLSDDN